MFTDATNFNQAIGYWNTSKVSNMAFMFNSATSFNQDLCAWYNNLQIGTSVDDMFSSSSCTNAANPDFITKLSFCQACTCNGGT
jgi:hypothetical protein